MPPKADILGVWKREVEEEPPGVPVDITSQVYWIQAGPYFGDIRIQDVRQPQWPHDASSWLSINEAQLKNAARQKAFAGQTQVDDVICTWHRELDYQPAEAEPDKGSLDFIEDNTRLVEECVRGEYREVWRREDDGMNGQMALVLAEEEDADGQVRTDRKGFFILSGKYWFYAVDRAQPLPAGLGKLGDMFAHIDDASEADVDAEKHRDLIAALDLEAMFGVRVIRKAQTLSFNVLHSTLPWREGSKFFGSARGEALKRFHVDRVARLVVERPQDATAAGFVRRLWRIEHWDGEGAATDAPGFDPLGAASQDE